ncbi:hypothetical protein PUN28_015387 [Cardiocondyla obscurior]|uniref:Uncharacterized protein n=1 Tax=Cardiocondyla obscurior TaxID=286306 RepID=A0AAW2EX53_9HYME
MVEKKRFFILKFRKHINLDNAFITFDIFFLLVITVYLLQQYILSYFRYVEVK